MSETHGLNIWFLAQGMLKLAPEQLPPGFYEWSRDDQIKWAQDFWENCTREDFMKALAYLDVEENSVPDCLEVDDEEYTILAETPAWTAFCSKGAQKLIDEEG
jgi:hypothetical protein